MSTALTAPTKIEADPIGTALVAAGVTSAAIEQLAKDYGELALAKTIDTPEQYEVIKRAQLAHRDIRTAVTSALKEEREEAVRYQKFVLQEEKRILAQIATTEEPLKKLREDYDKREELKALEEAKAWAEKMNLRKQAAFDIGYYFNGQAYLLDRENGEAPWVLREDQVAGMAMSDEALYALLDAQAAELKMTREIKAEAEAEAKAKEAEVAKKEAELIAQREQSEERFRAAQAELERKQKEMEERERQMNARVNEARKNELIAAGCVVGKNAGEDVVGVRIGSDLWGHLAVAEHLHTIPEGHWATMVQMYKEEVEMYAEEARKRDEEARKLIEQQQLERAAHEEKLKAEAAERAVAEERERAIREREAEEEEKKLLEEQEREKALQASDREKVDSLAHSLYCEFIDMDPLPVLKSAIGQAAMKSYAKQFKDIYASMVKLSKEL